MLSIIRKCRKNRNRLTSYEGEHMSNVVLAKYFDRIKAALRDGIEKRKAR